MSNCTAKQRTSLVRNLSKTSGRRSPGKLESIEHNEKRSMKILIYKLLESYAHAQAEFLQSANVPAADAG